MTEGLFDLSGRVALITGSSRGLGYVLAQGLAEHGARVVLNGRDLERLDAGVRALTAAGHDATSYPFDVTDAEAIERAVDEIESTVGPIDILFNNAGIQLRGPLHELAVADWRHVIETNLTSAFLVGSAVARRMIPRRYGKVINICSLQSEVTRPTIAPYTSAKGGLKMLTKGMCADWAPHGLTVNAIGPGYFATELTTSLRADPVFDGWVKGRTPVGRWGQPEDLIGAAVFLSSRASDFVNGQILYVDGGMLSVL